MWPGNTADVTTLIPVIDRLRRRFAIARVCVVADRGMISAETVAELEARRLLYILGVRERSDKLVRELVLEDAAPFVPLAIASRRQPRPACGRRRAAAERARSHGLLTPPNRKCSAKPPARRGLLLPISYLVIRTVEDG